MEIIEQIQEYVVRAKLGEHPQMEFQLGERLLAGSMRKNVWINPNDLCHVDVIVFADDNSVLSLESKANATLGMWEKSMVHLLSSHAASAAPHPRPCIKESHRGVVSEVSGDQVEITYETPAGPLRQIYRKEQFDGGILPNEGDDVEAKVTINVLDREPNVFEEEFESDIPSFEGRGIKGQARI